MYANLPGRVNLSLRVSERGLQMPRRAYLPELMRRYAKPLICVALKASEEATSAEATSSLACAPRPGTLGCHSQRVSLAIRAVLNDDDYALSLNFKVLRCRITVPQGPAAA